jgi:HEPN domain-containing protein
MTNHTVETINQSESPRFIEEAEAYYKTALGGLNRKRIFTNEILYNIIAMSIEKYLMGLLMSRNQLSPGHTLTSMIKEVKKYIPVEESLIKKMDYFDRLQFICSFTLLKREPVSDKDITGMIEILKEIKTMVQVHLLHTIKICG